MSMPSCPAKYTVRPGPVTSTTWLYPGGFCIVSGLENLTLSGIVVLPSVEAEKAGEVAVATASVVAPATTRRRETAVKTGSVYREGLRHSVASHWRVPYALRGLSHR
jgi:hypothetical protein